VADSIGGYPILLSGGERMVTNCWVSICGRHPRTAIGVDSEGRLLLVVVDGRRRRSVGMDLVRLADLMRRFGAISALNLDGGGSSTMVIRGRIVNRPSDGSQRSVSSAVLILDGTDRGEWIRAPLDPASAAVLPGEASDPDTTRGNLPVTGGGRVSRRARSPALFDPASTGGMLDAVDRGLFGGRGLPPALRVLLRGLRASGWSEGPRDPLE
jgi:hypothetical protein